jgi:hypothetical protein
MKPQKVLSRIPQRFLEIVLEILFWKLFFGNIILEILFWKLFLEIIFGNYFWKYLFILF